MATNFPASQDSLTNPTDSDTLDSPNHADQHADANDAIEAIQGALLDGAPLRIDDANNRVGIGTASPSTTLEVDGVLTANHIHGNLAGAIYLHVKNTSGVTIPAGSPVYATGSVGASGETEVSISDADNASTMPALGVIDTQLVNNAEGHAIVLGVATGLDTSGFAINDKLYVSTSGGLTNVRPTGESELVQKIARVIRSDASTGIILVGAGRSNDVPNNIVAGGLTIDTDTLHVDSTNNRVGIGTSSPAVQLQLAGTDDREALRLSGDGGGSGNQGSVFMGFHHWATGTHPSARIGVIETDDANYDASLVFQTRSSGADVVPSTRMTINESGNVGINDTTPSYALDVNGDINAQGYARSKGKKLGMALLHEDSLSGGVSTFQNQFNADYNNYRIVIDAAQNGNTTWTYFRFVNSSNTAISSGYYTAYFLDGTFGRQNSQSAAVAMRSGYDAYGGMVMDITLPYTGDNPSFHISSAGHDPSNTNVDSLWVHGYCVTSLDITGIQFYNGTPYGSVKVYGY